MKNQIPLNFLTYVEKKCVEYMNSPAAVLYNMFCTIGGDYLYREGQLFAAVFEGADLHYNSVTHFDFFNMSTNELLTKRINEMVDNVKTLSHMEFQVYASVMGARMQYFQRNIIPILNMTIPLQDDVFSRNKLLLDLARSTSLDSCDVIVPYYVSDSSIIYQFDNMTPKWLVEIAINFVRAMKQVLVQKEYFGRYYKHPEYATMIERADSYIQNYDEALTQLEKLQ